MQQKFYDTAYIEAYLQESLTATEQAAFEQALAADPQLQQVVAFQKNILEGIQQSRKAELKARLDQIVIPATPPFQGIKALAWGAAFLVSAVLVWFFFIKESPVPTTPEKMLTTTEQPEVERKQSQPLPEVTEETLVETETEESDTDIAEENIEEENLPSDEEVINSSNGESLQETTVLQEETRLSEEEERPANALGTEEGSKAFNYQIYYQYHDDVLQLFENIQYQLVKGDIGEGRKTYLYVKDQFFELKEDATEVFNLKDTHVTDKQQIEQLHRLLSK
ncbi:MAG: hypothetical protein ACFB0B_14940 [Thermonemataceae bacterium]